MSVPVIARADFIAAVKAGLLSAQRAEHPVPEPDCSRLLDHAKTAERAVWGEFTHDASGYTCPLASVGLWVDDESEPPNYTVAFYAAYDDTMMELVPKGTGPRGDRSTLVDIA